MNAAEPLPACDPKLEARIDELVELAFLKDKKLPGVTVAIVLDGAPLIVKAYGLADAKAGRSVSGERTLFRTGSVSKVLTATAVMQLVDQGRLDLDADVNDYLDFHIPDTFREPVTLKNLLTHTGGFEECQLGFMFAANASSPVPLGEHLARHMPARVRPPLRDFNDGTTAGYSNWGMALAGHIVARCAGMPFDAYVERHIFEPLGMARSSFREPLPEDWQADIAHGHVYRAGKNGASLEPQAFEYVHGLGPAMGFTTTSADMARFMLAHLAHGEHEGRRILAADSVRLMHSRILSPHPAVNGAGLAFYELHLNGRRLLYHGGKLMHCGAQIALYPDEGLGVFVAANGADDVTGRMHRFLQWFMDDFFPEMPVDWKPFEGTARRRTGYYRPVPGPETKNEKARLLFDATTQIKVVACSERSLIAPNLGSDSHWTEIEPGVFRADGSPPHGQIAFLENADGQTRHIVGPLPFMPARRLAWYERLGFHRVLLPVCLFAFVAALGSSMWWAFAAVGTDVTATVQNLRWLVAAVAATGLAGSGLIAHAFTRSYNQLATGFPASLRAGLTLVLLMVPLTLGASGMVAAAWWLDAGTVAERAVWTGFALPAFAFLWSLHYWRLLGYRYA